MNGQVENIMHLRPASVSLAWQGREKAESNFNGECTELTPLKVTSSFVVWPVLCARDVIIYWSKFVWMLV